MKLCEFTPGTWATEACDTSEKDQLQDTQWLSCLNLEVFCISSGLSCLSLCQHSQKPTDKQEVYKVYQMLPYPILVCPNSFLLITYHFCQNFHWYSLFQLISCRKWARKKMTCDKWFRITCHKHLGFILLCLGLRFICYAGRAEFIFFPGFVFYVSLYWLQQLLAVLLWDERVLIQQLIDDESLKVSNSSYKILFLITVHWRWLIF